MTLDDTTHDNPDLPLLPPTYPVMFLVGVVVLEFVVPLSFLPQPAFISLHTLGAVLLVAAGFGLAIWSTATFRAQGTNVEPIKPTLKIVTSGPYRLSRNPIYFGFLLIYLGIALGFGLEWGVITLPFLWLTLHRVVVKREEAYLSRKFGDEYEDYLARTRRWL